MSQPLIMHLSKNSAGLNNSFSSFSSIPTNTTQITSNQSLSRSSSIVSNLNNIDKIEDIKKISSKLCKAVKEGLVKKHQAESEFEITKLKNEVNSLKDSVKKLQKKVKKSEKFEKSSKSNGPSLSTHYILVLKEKLKNSKLRDKEMNQNRLRKHFENCENRENFEGSSRKPETFEHCCQNYSDSSQKLKVFQRASENLKPEAEKPSSASSCKIF